VQGVYSLFFLTNVTGAQVLKTASAILAIEASDFKVFINGVATKLSGLTGIFNSLTDTSQTATDGEMFLQILTLMGRDVL
jgi:hypothetical protein